MLFHVFTLPGPALTLSHYFQALHCDTAPEGVPTVLSSPLRWGYAISSLRLAHWGLGQGSRCLSAGGGQQGPGAGLEILDGHLGVIVAEQAVVAGPHAGAVAVAVAATLRGTVAADEAEVAAAVVGLHTRAVHATLGAHWAAQPRHAAGRGWGSGQGSSRPLRRADLAGVRVLTASQSPPDHPPSSPLVHPAPGLSHHCPAPGSSPEPPVGAMSSHSRAPSQTSVPTCPPWTKCLPHALLHTLDCGSLHPAWVHAPSLTAPHRLSHSTVGLACSPQPHQSPGPAGTSLVHGVACLAAALVTVGPVVAVLGLVVNLQDP